MKITAVYNRAGKILAAAVVSDERGGPIPVASKGVKSGVFEVPEALRDLELHTLCSSHRIDTRKRGVGYDETEQHGGNEEKEVQVTSRLATTSVIGAAQTFGPSLVFASEDGEQLLNIAIVGQAISIFVATPRKRRWTA